MLLFLTVPWVDLQFVIVVFPDHTLLFFLPSVNTFKQVVNSLEPFSMLSEASHPYLHYLSQL